MFSRIYERLVHENLAKHVNIFLSKFISAYRKFYSTSHVLICLIENWKKSLDKNKFVGAVLMALSKAFESMPNGFLMANMYAYGFYINAVTFSSHTEKDVKKCKNLTILIVYFKYFYLEFPKTQYLVHFFSIYL